MKLTHATASSPVKTARVSIRMTVAERARVAGAAAVAKLPASALARVFIAFAADELAKGNPALDRAIKVSRDRLTLAESPVPLTPGSTARIRSLARIPRE